MIERRFRGLWQQLQGRKPRQQGGALGRVGVHSRDETPEVDRVEEARPVEHHRGAGARAAPYERIERSGHEPGEIAPSTLWLGSQPVLRRVASARERDRWGKCGRHLIDLIPTLLSLTVVVMAGFAARPLPPADSSVLRPHIAQPGEVTVDTLQYQWNRENFDTIPLVRATILLVTSWGEVWVTDVGERAVYRWSTDGDELSRVGGRGSGPGEFIRPGIMIEMNADSVGVWDRQLQRMSFFGRNGEFRSIRKIPISMTAHGFLNAVSLRGDTALVMAVTNPSIEPSPRDNRVVLWRFVGTDLRPDSLLSVQDESVTISRSDGNSTRFMAPFRGRAHAFFPESGNIIVGHGEADSLSVLSHQGHHLRRIDLDLPLLQVTRMDRGSFSDSLRVALDEEVRRSGAGPAARAALQAGHKRIIRDIEFPDSHPRYTDAFQDATGLVWLRTAARSDAEYLEWRAYHYTTGDQLRSVFLPNDGGFLNTRTDGSAFFVTRADALGQTRLVKYGRRVPLRAARSRDS